MEEINKTIGEGVTEYAGHKKREFISPIFFFSNSDGTSRLTPNLKTLNQFLGYHQFKL